MSKASVKEKQAREYYKMVKRQEKRSKHGKGEAVEEKAPEKGKVTRWRW